ncbi:MAG: nucleotidyltransferase family protein [Pseudomonadota bacterium]
MIPILILAAGTSSRMRGRDKLLEEVDGQPLLGRQISIAQRVSTDVRVALPRASNTRHSIVGATSARPVIVPDANEGMGASLRTIFRTLGSERYAMLLLGDLPDLTEEDVRAVLAARLSHPSALIWRGATDDGRGGHPILFDRVLFPALQKLAGDDGGRSVVESVSEKVHLVPLPGNRARNDLDTPEDWAAWRAARGVI